ncbi:MAG: leucyl/phenylalanyl-tRNA--protein transferase [Aquisalimonadaceae bacterium]
MTSKRLYLLDHEDEAWFPPLDQALDEPNGLLAVGGTLSPTRLQAAYAQGAFPWFEEDQPILWWSPDPRAVLFPERLRVTRSLGKRIRNGGFRVTMDTSFDDVIGHCAAPRRDSHGTWITRDMRQAYGELHQRGIAHSVEVWKDSELVGGLYGVGMGLAFFGESMFSLQPDASKIGLVYLVRQLERRGCQLIDCQVASHHLASLGATEIPRGEFARRLAIAVASHHQSGPWTFDPGFEPLRT